MIFHILRPDFKKRTFGNAAATAIAIAAGADMVRVHEVKEMSQTALVCDRIYKRKESSKLWKKWLASASVVNQINL